MKKFKVIVAMSTLFFASHGHADCQMLKPKIEKIRERNERLSKQVVANIYGTSKLMWSWHSDLSEYEGKTVHFRSGYFDAIAESARITQQSGRNLGLMFNDIDLQISEILNLAEKCIK